MERIGNVIPGALESVGVEIKAIPTLYRGFRFRSRLEARWAVFLDRLDVAWEYEAEGFDLPGGRYLPDFKLPKWNAGRGAWLEVKPPYPTPCKWPPAEELVCATRMNLYVAQGMPQEHAGISAYIYSDGEVWSDEDWAICQCQKCHSIGIEYGGMAHRICGERCFPTSTRGHEGFNDKLRDAVDAAQRERFWDPK